MLTVHQGGTISFVHAKPPRGAHKTYARWLPRKLEKVKPIQISGNTYAELIGVIMMQADRNPLCERRSDNTLCLVIGDQVFSDSEYQLRRAARIAAEGGA